MSEPQDQAAAEVAAQQRQISGTVGAGTAQQAPVQDAAAAAAVGIYADTHKVPNVAPAAAFSAPAQPDNPVTVGQTMNPFAAIDPAVMDALRAQVVKDVTAQFEAQARQKEIESTQQSGWYPAPDGWVRTEDRETTPTLPGEHKYATAAVTRDVFLPGGGTQPVVSHLMVSPQGDLVASV